jgi:hypothetical protein
VICSILSVRDALCCMCVVCVVLWCCAPQSAAAMLLSPKGPLQPLVAIHAFQWVSAEWGCGMSIVLICLQASAVTMVCSYYRLWLVINASCGFVPLGACAAG